MFKTAIVHDSLREFGGAEKVVEHWLSTNPKAHIYTLCFRPEVFAESKLYMRAWREGRITTTFEQKYCEQKWYQKLFKLLVPLHVWAMKKLRVRGYQKVLVSSVYFAKFVSIEKPETLVHYCHSPSRFLHGLQTELDRNTLNPVVRWIEKLLLPGLKRDDVRAAQKLTDLDAEWQCNSHFMQAEIKLAYGVTAQIVYPPIELEKYSKIMRNIDIADPFYLYFGRVGGHKRVDLAIKACLEMGRKLMVSGGFSSDAEKERCQTIVSQHPNGNQLITFLGRQSFEQNVILFSQCRAFLFPGKEDFGITPVEMLGAGIPVIAYGEGGSREYMRDGENGVLFGVQSVESLKTAIQTFENREWDEKTIRASVAGFAKPRIW